MAQRYYCPCAHCRMRGLMGPAVLIAVGLLFLARELGWQREFWELSPIILIVIGVVKLAQALAPTTGHLSAEARSSPSGGETSNV